MRTRAALVVLIAAAIVWGVGLQRRVVRASQTEVILAEGNLVHHKATNALFHIGSLWMRVNTGTLLHRWLESGSGNRAAIALTTDPDRYADLPNIRIFTGRLIHQIDPRESPLVHLFLLQDEETGGISPIMFETKDRMLMALFDEWSEMTVSIVIEVRPE